MRMSGNVSFGECVNAGESVCDGERVCDGEDVYFWDWKMLNLADVAGQYILPH